MYLCCGFNSHWESWEPHWKSLCELRCTTNGDWSTFSKVFPRASDGSLNIEESGWLYKFGYSAHLGIGAIKIISFTGSFTYLAEIHTEVVKADILFLLGLDVLSNFKKIVDFGEDVVNSRCDECTLLIIHKMGHAYVKWVLSLLSTEYELDKFIDTFSILKQIG